MAVVRLGAGRWTPVAIAAAAFALVVGGGLAIANGGGDGAEATSTTTSFNEISLVDPSEDTAPAQTVPPSAVTTAPPDNSIAKVPLDRTLGKGMYGSDVKALQQRLKDLSFDPGPIDGQYGDYTVQAVWAFETLVMGTTFNQVTGKVTPEMWDTMQGNVVVAPRRTNLTSLHVEIYLPLQALVVFKDNRPILSAHISSGELEAPGDDFTKGKEWCEEVTISPGERGNDTDEEIKDGRCGNAWTPGGTYRFYRMYVGNRESALGGMQNPVYFNYGIAIHGAYNVPDEPDSHGCIRINHYLGEYFYTLIEHASGSEAHPKGDQVYVWNGVKEPEEYGQKTGTFDWVWQEWRDENSTTTSTSSTSSTSTTSTTPGTTDAGTTPTATTTAEPPTTPAPATTPAPPPTTTTAAPTTVATTAPPPPPPPPTDPPATAPPGP